MGKTRFSLWNVPALACAGGVAYTTFQPVIQATIVHPSVAGSVFDITSYVSSLSELYAPWLPLMMSEGSGQRTSALLQMGTTALYALCAIAVIALVLVAASFVANALGRRRIGRVCGLVGFIAALVVPIACIAIVGIVQYEMSSSLISIAVLDVRPVCYAQMALAAVGAVFTVFSTRRIADPHAENRAA